IDPVEETVAEPAREALLEVERLLGREREAPAAEGSVEGGAVGAGRGGDVVRALETALDLEAGDAGADEVGEEVVSREILGREEVGAVAEVARSVVDDHLIGETTSLRALPAIGAASAERFAGQALAAVGDAERPVHEDLERDVGGGAQLLDLRQRE